ncbi:class II aldolase/adducin-like protein [Bradyrhizobium oligotrophicum S58]|uniref:Class II aldolase/adducin-like protein n=1 Tax=Bradyrhizobium oligotrophicum S58 TaxID=1245469 RepID=M4Z4B6_9BRAD|nr:class II aldolase/adducin family protein [Bradyrhizobium oligotrophicum]BAM87797.1 class II aldolase/adducin-like protein [Bradyrhizobium oligotrophicum S58]
MSKVSCFAAIAFATVLLSAAPSRAQDSIPGVPRELLDDIAAGSRILADLGVVDAFGHVSARHPTNPGHFLMARSVAPAQVTADDIMEFDENGEAVDARGRTVFLERFIHAEIYRARPDVKAVVHTHSPGVVPFSVSRTTLRPLYHNAAFLGAGAAVWDIGKDFGTTNMLVSNNAIGKSLASALGDKSVVLMRGHGDVTVGSAVKVAVFRAYYTDVNAKLQTQAIGLGSEITFLSAEEATKADAVNMVIMDRAWALWKQKVQAGK